MGKEVVYYLATKDGAFMFMGNNSGEWPRHNMNGALQKGSGFLKMFTAPVFGQDHMRMSLREGFNARLQGPGVHHPAPGKGPGMTSLGSVD